MNKTPSLTHRPIKQLAFALACGFMLLSAVLCLCVGAVSIELSDIWAVLTSGLTGQGVDYSLHMSHSILFHIRLPRVLLCLLVGACLGVTGATMQGLFRNPLADPGLIGVSAGSALGASVAIVLGHALLPVVVPAVILAWAQLVFVPVCAFLGGVGVTFLVYKLASQHGKTQVATLLLAGVAIQAMAGAGIGLLTYMADDTQLRDLTFWSMGSFAGAQWQQLAMVAVFLVPALIFLACQGRSLNAFLLGEYEAGHIGIRVEVVKRKLIVVTALAVGVAVSATGMIGFVGLVVPHLIRLAFGANHRFLLPMSLLLGATLLLWADTLARTLISPAELPIGILTAILGAPFFMFLLIRYRNGAKL